MTNEEQAQEHYTNAKVASLAGDKAEIAIAEFEKAFALGLPGKEEAFARALSGSQYIQLALQRGLPLPQAIRSSEWEKAEVAYITALRIDREGGYGQFSSLLGRALLGRFDRLCSVAGSIRAQEDAQAGLEYLENMLATCKHLPSSPLLMSLSQIGFLYKDAGEKERALESWQQLVAAEPVDPVDEDQNETRLRQNTRDNIALIQREMRGEPAQRSEKGCVVLLVLASVPSLLAFVVSLLR